MGNVKYENVTNGRSDSNYGLGDLIDKFNQETEVSIKIDVDVTLNVIFKKLDEVSAAIKRLKQAYKILEAIHAEYTLSLECDNDASNVDM